ncbi:MAG: insulinase family protein [Kofleriaceae bacterium]|nr:insulinase family protein [Kofleriaceae bacterium]
MNEGAALEIIEDAIIVGARHRRLACGVDVLVHRDITLPQVAVSMCYRAGSSDEVPGASGLAHLVEHLFKNSLHLRGRKHYEVLREIGASDANASTGPDRTEYHQVVPANQLPMALWLESDRMGYFLPALLAERITQQKAVVRSERRQRYENTAYGAERFVMAEALYAPDHPHRHLTIGRHEDIEAASWQSIADFYRRYYPPANATLVIAGDVDDAHCDDLVDQYFGTFPCSAPALRRTVDASELVAHQVTVPDGFAKLQRLHWVWRGPVMGSDDGRILDVLLAALAMPGTGELWRALIYDQLLAQRVSAYAQLTRLGGELHVVVDARPGGARADVISTVQRVLNAAIQNGISTEHIHRVVARRRAGAMWSMQSLLNRTTRLQHWSLYGDRALTAQAQRTHACKQRNITTLDTIAAAMRWLTAPAVLVCTEPTTVSGSSPA